MMYETEYIIIQYCLLKTHICAIDMYKTYENAARLQDSLEIKRENK